MITAQQLDAAAAEYRQVLEALVRLGLPGSFVVNLDGTNWRGANYEIKIRGRDARRMVVPLGTEVIE